MANWSNPTLTSLYTDFLTQLKDRDDDLAKQFDGQTLSNIPTNAIRWNSSVNRWQKWSGSAWAELTTTYALTGLSTTGNAAIGGTLSVTGVTGLAAGTVGAPGLYLSTDTTTGWYRPTTNTLAYSIAGTESFRINSTGALLFGTASNAGNPTIRIERPMTGGATQYSIWLGASIDATVSSTASGIRSGMSVVDNAALGTVNSFQAENPTLGTGASITNNIGYEAGPLSGASAFNIAFRGRVVSAATNWNCYMSGGAPNYFAGDVRTNAVITQRTVPAIANTTATATAASLKNGLRTGTPTTGINLQVPTGTSMDAEFQDLQTNHAFAWSLINLAPATHAITVTSNTDHTLVGNMVVAASSSGRFITQKTAANTFVTYRAA